MFGSSGLFRLPLAGPAPSLSIVPVGTNQGADVTIGPTTIAVSRSDIKGNFISVFDKTTGVSLPGFSSAAGSFNSDLDHDPATGQLYLFGSSRLWTRTPGGTDSPFNTIIPVGTNEGADVAAGPTATSGKSKIFSLFLHFSRPVAAFFGLSVLRATLFCGGPCSCVAEPYEAAGFSFGFDREWKTRCVTPADETGAVDGRRNWVHADLPGKV